MGGEGSINHLVDDHFVGLCWFAAVTVEKVREVERA